MRTLLAAASAGPGLDLLPVWLDLGLSGVALAALTWVYRAMVRNVLSGDQVPRRELDYLREDRDARLRDKDAEIAREREVTAEWRAAHETSEHTRALQAEQIRNLVDAVRASGYFVDSVRATAATVRRATADDADHRDTADDAGT